MSMNVPAFLAQATGRAVAQSAVGGIASSQPPHISIRGNVFTLVDSAGNEKPVEYVLTDQRGQQVRQQASYLDVVVVAANPGVSKIYYEGKWSPDAEAGPPACFSDNGVAPSSQAQKPQSPTCAGCPQNAWGSAVNAQTGNQRKACNDKKKLALILPGDESGIVYQIQIPPASLKNMQGVMHMVAQQSLGARNADITDVVTRIKFQAGTNGVLEFELVSFIDEATFRRIETLAKDPARLEAIVGANDVPRTAAIAAPVQQPVAQIAAPREGPIQTSAFQQGPFIQPPNGATAPMQAAEPRRRRGRPAAVEAAPPAVVPISAGQPQPSIVPSASAGAPSFLQAAQPGQQSVANFGIVQTPQQAGDDVEAKIKAAFALPLAQ